MGDKERSGEERAAVVEGDVEEEASGVEDTVEGEVEEEGAIERADGVWEGVAEDGEDGKAADSAGEEGEEDGEIVREASEELEKDRDVEEREVGEV